MNDSDRYRAGFEAFTRTGAARAQLLSAVTPTDGTERVGLREADGWVVARPVKADRPVPHYERAAVDGYAARASDAFGASERSSASRRRGAVSHSSAGHLRGTMSAELSSSHAVETVAEA